MNLVRSLLEAKKGNYEQEFLEKQRNSLKLINDYSLEKFSMAVEDSACFSLKKSKFSKLCLITAYLMFLIK